MNIFQRTNEALIIRHHKRIYRRILFNEQIVADHKFARALVQPVTGSCSKTIVPPAGVIQCTVEVEGINIDVADYLSLVRQVGVLTFAVQVAFIYSRLGRSRHRAYPLP